MEAVTSGRSYLELLDYRRRVMELYAEVRALRERDAGRAHLRWRAERDLLFGRHPQSALPAQERARFRGLAYHEYDPAFAFSAAVRPLREERYDVPTSTGGVIPFVRFGAVDLPIGALEVFWLDAYGGGVFLPFRDATSGHTTYGGGRYLLDTAKGADLGSETDRLILDFNFAYHPSCHYDPQWVCPLAPPANRLDVAIEAGELVYPGSSPHELAWRGPA
ncbi:MAG: hypothetical protein AUH85_15395 [Chloroflexi bacterium 13_1_40CM_4_68_4]|nr:MAG: hypothetical protein AUH85_15395 [Chloroflexi bacterium 13_1_40CM_4_68_4]